MKAAGIKHILAMGRLQSPASDPLGIAGIHRLKSFVPGLHAIGAIDPNRTSTDALQAVETVIKAGKVKALKAYLGYLHQPADSPGFQPYYELAATYEIPVVLHTGDTYSTTAKLRNAHPLVVDDLAVEHPNVNFVMAHFGSPWLADGALVVYKNPNVWADLSGLIVGTEALFSGHFKGKKPIGEIDDVILDVRKALRYAGKPDRFLFGSDWPLAPIASYKTLVERIIPASWHEQVFETNARQLFKLD